LRRHGFHTRLWSVDPHDYQPGIDTQDVTDALAGSSAGDVVLLHDALEEAPDGAPDRKVLLDSLPDAIADIQRRGLTLVALS
jgi:peptidoglycan/xylan/chitin deacetylase (PgdA/CDA1 family)